VIGVVASAAVTNTSAIAAARGLAPTLAPWSAPELIPAIPATTDEGRPLSPLNAPAFDTNGDAFIVWTEPIAATTAAVVPEYRVSAAMRPADGHWQPGQTLSRLGLNPEVTVDARGDAIATWEGRSGVEAAIKLVGGGWLAPQIVGSPRGEEAHEPQLASDASGDAIVVSPLQVHGHGSTGIQVAVRRSGGAFSPAQTISLHPEDALDPCRHERAWRRDRRLGPQVGTGCQLRAAFRPAGGAWGAPRTVPDGHELCRGRHRVVIGERGNAIVAWVAMQGSTMLVETASRGVSGRWSAQRVIGTASAAAEPPGVPQLGMDAHGDAIALWIDPALVLGGRRTMWARIRPAGRGWGTLERIADVAYESSPSIAMDARGDAAVVWEDKRGIEEASHPASGGWQKPRTVSDRKSAEIAFEAMPVLALDARGDGVVSWQGDRSIETAWHASLFP